MKIKINKKSISFVIEIPPAVHLNHVSIGEKFPIFIHHKDNQIEKTTACFLAERRSLLIGHRVVALKPEDFLKNHLDFEIVRDVTPSKKGKKSSGGNLLSPMAGKVISLSVENGCSVKKGDTLLIIEAMKMENSIFAFCDGIITNLSVEKGKTVATGDLLLAITPEKEDKA